LYFSLRVRDLLDFVLAVLLAAADFLSVELLPRIAGVFFVLVLVAEGFLPGDAFLVVFAFPVLFLAVEPLCAAGFFLVLVVLFDVFFV
jgi:hypothetical protein